MKLEDSYVFSNRLKHRKLRQCRFFKLQIFFEFKKSLRKKNRENPQGGGAFINNFFLMLAEIKTTPQVQKQKNKCFLRKFRGWGFYPTFRCEASQNKNPTPLWVFATNPCIGFLYDNGKPRNQRVET